MEPRKLRIVKKTPNIGGVCERCGARFDSDSFDEPKAATEIAVAFEAHKCLPLDSSQNALRVVRKATENK